MTFRQAVWLFGLTHAINVMALVKSSELLSATVIRSLTPSNSIALPNRPAVVRVGALAPLNAPLLPLPLESIAVLPLVSSKPNEAPWANGFTVTVAVHDVVCEAESVTFSTTLFAPGRYGPGGTCAAVTGPPSGSFEPLLILAIAVPTTVAVTVML